MSRVHSSKIPHRFSPLWMYLARDARKKYPVLNGLKLVPWQERVLAESEKLKKRFEAAHPRVAAALKDLKEKGLSPTGRALRDFVPEFLPVPRSNMFAGPVHPPIRQSAKGIDFSRALQSAEHLRDVTRVDRTNLVDHLAEHFVIARRALRTPANVSMTKVTMVDRDELRPSSEVAGDDPSPTNIDELPESEVLCCPLCRQCTEYHNLGVCKFDPGAGKSRPKEWGDRLPKSDELCPHCASIGERRTVDHCNRLRFTRPHAQVTGQSDLAKLQDEIDYSEGEEQLKDGVVNIGADFEPAEEVIRIKLLPKGEVPKALERRAVRILIVDAPVNSLRYGLVERIQAEHLVSINIVTSAKPAEKSATKEVTGDDLLVASRAVDSFVKAARGPHGREAKGKALPFPNAGGKGKRKGRGGKKGGGR